MLVIASPMEKPHSGDIMDGIPGVLACGKLSKKTLFSLPEGGLLSSNVTDGIGHPLVAEPVAPLAEREAQWCERRRESGMKGAV
jgi:hypothetical protein